MTTCSSEPTALVTQHCPHKQGIIVLGTPLGCTDFVEAQLAEKTEEHGILLERIPKVSDLQCAWRLRPTLAKPTLAILIFRLWPNRLWPNRLWPKFRFRCMKLIVEFFIFNCFFFIVIFFVIVFFCDFLLFGFFFLQATGPNPEIVGPEGEVRRAWGPEGWGAQNFALFFSLSRHKISFVLFFPGGLVEFWWCFERRNPEMCTSGVLALSEPRRPGLVGPPGFHTTAREPKRAHFRVPAFKTPPKFNEKTPRETQKERNGGGRGKKKSEILGGPAEGGSGGGGSSGGVVGGRWSREVQTNNHNNHNYNNAKPRTSGALKGRPALRSKVWGL